VITTSAAAIAAQSRVRPVSSQRRTESSPGAASVFSISSSHWRTIVAGTTTSVPPRCMLSATVAS
jgi:hypothetical protein